MKKLIPILVLLSMLSGCSKPLPTVPAPVSEGELIHVELLGQPYPEYSPHSLSWNTYSDGTVKIYENFIIITTEDGISHLSLHNWYKNLRYRQ